MVCLSVGRSVGQSVTIFSTAETAQPIEMPFWLWTLVGPRNYVLDGSQDIPSELAVLRGGTLSAQQMAG